MNDPIEHNPDDIDPFARDDSPATESNSDQDADGMAIHGILSLLQPGESDRIQARIDRAIATIRESTNSSRLIWRERLAWVGGSVGIAAAIALAVLYVPAGSDSSAFAALESIRGSARQGGRNYSVRFEMDGMGAPKPDGIRPSLPARDHAKPSMRKVELALGSGGRWTLSMSGAPAGNQPDHKPVRQKLVFGFDGTSYWAVGPDGATRDSASLKDLKVPPFMAAIEGGDQEGDEDLDLLTLDSILTRLDRDYTVSFDRDSVRAKQDGRSVTIVTAQRTGKRESRGPQTVRIVADSKTFEVLRANWEWAESASAAPDRPAPSKPRMKRIFLELASTPAHGNEWFGAAAHVEQAADRPKSSPDGY